MEEQRWERGHPVWFPHYSETSLFWGKVKNGPFLLPHAAAASFRKAVSVPLLSWGEMELGQREAQP
jgi:hypothetical protein